MSMHSGLYWEVFRRPVSLGRQTHWFIKGYFVLVSASKSTAKISLFQ